MSDEEDEEIVRSFEASRCPECERMAKELHEERKQVTRFIAEGTAEMDQLRNRNRELLSDLARLQVVADVARDLAAIGNLGSVVVTGSGGLWENPRTSPGGVKE